MGDFPPQMEMIEGLVSTIEDQSSLGKEACENEGEEPKRTDMTVGSAFSRRSAGEINCKFFSNHLNKQLKIFPKT